MSEPTALRKADHIRIALEEDVGAKAVTAGFERLALEHCALPDGDLDQVDLSLTLWGKTLKAPLLISSMTGGTAEAGRINQCLAEAAQALGIAMGVGSQRAALEAPELAQTYQIRERAPDILLFANLGLVQFNYGYGMEEARRAVEMIGADALILHLNPLQEAVQAGGDRNWSGLWRRLEEITRQLTVPVIVKEVGNGISAGVAKRLEDCGAAAIDVAGAGGTSWSEVEAHRQTDPRLKQIAHAFAGWGIPTAVSLRAALGATDLPIFASGGLRSGIDCAKALALGAALAGSAAPLLGPATVDAEQVYERFNGFLQELKIAAFCCGAFTLAQLAQVPLYDSHTWQRMVKPR
ncbi:MAG: type 2 isopentenyl-diphosphate Delta-isomerase [Cyanobacteriota bacterium]|nr:type 2 isopentenyl-diphosphate Delta-isomerase [Cyanobacteriota bacterium]